MGARGWNTVFDFLCIHVPKHGFSLVHIADDPGPSGLATQQSFTVFVTLSTDNGLTAIGQIKHLRHFHPELPRMLSAGPY